LNAPAHPQPAPAPLQRTRTRLIIAAALIGLAVASLAAVEQFRDRPVSVPAPHEPSQALIAPPAPPPEPAAAAPGTTAPEPPPPPVVVNEPDTPPIPAAAPRPPTGAAIDNPAYLVQAGVFTSPANAQSLQQRLAKAGIRAKVETRVQLGPYKDRLEAEQALARLKKLGVNAVMVPAR
jgi:DedD protein